MERKVINVYPLNKYDISDSINKIYQLYRASFSACCSDYPEGTTFQIDNDTQSALWLTDENENKLYVPLGEKKCFIYC